MLNDTSWFGKMQLPFMRDSRCGMVDAAPFTKSQTAYPVKRSIHLPSTISDQLILVKRDLLNEDPVGISKDHYIPRLAQQAVRLGFSSWEAPGVGYEVVDHEEHVAWRAPSAPEAVPSESSSQTILD